MEDSIEADNISFRYELRDVKSIQCSELEESPQMEDKILAVLCKVDNPEGYFQKLSRELLKLPEKQRADYIRKLLTALQYRTKLRVVLNSLMEEGKLPITITKEMMESDPFFKKGLREGKIKEKLKTQKEIIVNIYRKLNLSLEKIAEVLFPLI